MKSICTMTLVMLCTALFIMLDAAPVLPSEYESEAVGEQQFDKMAKTFLNVFSKISRDGSIQADYELGKHFASNFLSGVSKKPDLNDDPQETLYNGFNPIPYSIGKRLNEGGEIQSGGKLLPRIINLFGTHFLGVPKKTDNGVQSRNESDIKEVMQTLLNSNVTSNFLSAFVLRTFRPFFSEIENLLSAESKNANPNDEVMQVGFKGLKTLFTLLRQLYEDLFGGEIQPSDDKIKQPFMNSFLSGIRKKSDDDEIQLVSHGFDLIDAGLQTVINVFKVYFIVGCKYGYHKNEADMGIFDAVATFYSFIVKLFGNLDKIKSKDLMQTLMKYMKYVVSTYMKMVENGEGQSTDEIVPDAFLNLCSNILPAASQMIDPSDEVAQSGLSTILSTVGQEINGREGRQIQSNIDIELPKTILNLFGTVGSALQKKVNPKDELVQILLTLFNTWISGTKNSNGGAQEIQVDTLPTYAYAAKHFDQSMLKSMDEKAAVVEANVDLTDEAKIQLWGAILGSLASGVLSKATDG